MIQSEKLAQFFFVGVQILCWTFIICNTGTAPRK